MSSIKSNARKIVCIGRNYADHIKELNSARPKRPFFFLKPPTSILPPNSGPVLRPQGVTLHYEVELALIMGKALQDLEEEDEEQAMSAIEGYAVGVDMTARNLQDEAKRKGLPWSIAKGFDTFLPISNPIPKSAIPDPYNAHLYLSINGITKQSGSTELMLFRIPRMLSDISKVMTLEPGDLVLTGTPKGVGPVQAGDIIRAGVKVDEKEINGGRIEVSVKDREGGFKFQET
ncbi:MAG: hypothetical protein M1813_008080 [Trichoglossum hirsutum]|nr:MAG: hypothetical protein M1813_008080 [Trichoglossum hirsutum]